MATEAELKAEQEKADAAARADADTPPWAKKLADAVGESMAKCDATMTRMDSIENLFKADKARADAEEAKEKEEKEKADKARADAEAAAELEKGAPAETAADKAKADKARADAEAEKEKEEVEKADAARADAAKKDAARDAEVADLRAKFAALTGAVHVSDEDRVALADIQSRADSVFSAFGERAPQPMAGENAINYRRRLAAKLKPHSSEYKDMDLSVVPDAMLHMAEKSIYADAKRVAEHPADIPAGTLREIKKADRTGRIISEFVGHPSAWMDQFKSVGVQQLRINKEF